MVSGSPRRELVAWGAASEGTRGSSSTEVALELATRSWVERCLQLQSHLAL